MALLVSDHWNWCARSTWEGLEPNCQRRRDNCHQLCAIRSVTSSFHLQIKIFITINKTEVRILNYKNLPRSLWRRSVSLRADSSFSWFIAPLICSTWCSHIFFCAESSSSFSFNRSRASSRIWLRLVHSLSPSLNKFFFLNIALTIS